MGEAPDIPAERPGLGNLLWIAVPCLLFLLRIVLWWRNWWKGAVTPSSMTGGEWFSIVLSHAAVLGGVIVLALVLRDREKASGPAA